MNKIKGFSFIHSKWFYIKIISLIFLAGFIMGMKVPQVSFKDQPLADWIVALCTVGIFLIAFKTKNQWLKQKDLENHTQFTKAFYQYYLLKVSMIEPVKIEFNIKSEIKNLNKTKWKHPSQESFKLDLEKKQNELNQHKEDYKAAYLESDQAKEKMLVMASVIRVHRNEIKDISMFLATYQMKDVINDFKKFKDEINKTYLDIQRIYFSESELIHLPE